MAGGGSFLLCSVTGVIFNLYSSGSFWRSRRHRILSAVASGIFLKEGQEAESFRRTRGAERGEGEGMAWVLGMGAREGGMERGEGGIPVLLPARW